MTIEERLKTMENNVKKLEIKLKQTQDCLDEFVQISNAADASIMLMQAEVIKNDNKAAN